MELLGENWVLTWWGHWALSLRRDLVLFVGCLGLRQNQQTALRTPAWPVLLWFKKIKLCPIEKELKSCCFWECYFNVLVQWVGLVVYNSETLEHLWIVREVHYSLSAVRHSSCQLSFNPLIRMQNITYDQSQAMNNGLTKWTVLQQFRPRFVNQNYSEPDSGTPSNNLNMHPLTLFGFNCIYSLANLFFFF